MSQINKHKAYLPHLSLIEAIEAKDHYTRGHSNRVTRSSLAIGRELGLSEEELKKLRNGAELHDIGKIGTPDSILNKQGKLTPEEREIIEKHPLEGARILEPGEFITQEEREMVRSHHERLDGSGYPDCLMSNEIPLGARIVAVADVYDAMTSNRSYRLALPKEEVREELKRGANSGKYDRKVVAAFLKVCPNFS